jgi:hypothetical protein
MTIGIEQFRNSEELRLDRMLLQRRANMSPCRLRQPQDEWLAVSLWGAGTGACLARARRKQVCLRGAQALSLGLWLGAVSGLLFLLLVIE